PTPTRHPFPTRRSSDLVAAAAVDAVAPPPVQRGDEDVAAGIAVQAVSTALADDTVVAALSVLHVVGEVALEQIVAAPAEHPVARSEEHTSELQSPYDLV